MIYEVSAATEDIDFAPAPFREVIQNVRTILATRAGEVPMDRDFGISWAFVGMPIPRAVATLNAEVVQKIRRYEPRARVIRVTLGDTDFAQNRIEPNVEIEVML